jgi:hypothetical protein
LRRWIVAGVVAVGLVAAGPMAATAAPPSQRPTAISKSCSAGYKHAVIGGSEKCLRRGQFCAIAHKRQYVRYGFRCVVGRLR